MARPDLHIHGARVHNLRGVDVTIPRGSLTVVTGLSGSGKSSLAFDTIYAEGQRRYIESLSSYARQFLDALERPDVEHIEGLSPAISIEQKTASHNPRSTVGTVSEVYDYLRVLYAAVGQPRCPECGRALERQTPREIVDRIMGWPEGTRLLVMAPIVRGRKGIYRKELHEALQAGFVRAKIDGELHMLDQPIELARQKAHTIQIVVDRLVLKAEEAPRVASAVDIALQRADGLVTVEVLPGRDATVKGGLMAGKGAPEAGEVTFSESLTCPDHGPQLVEIAPRIFSFNSPYGACPACRGIGTVREVDEAGVVPDPSLSLAEGAIAPWEEEAIESPVRADGRSKTGKNFKAMCEAEGIDLDAPWRDLPDAARELLLRGEWRGGAASTKSTKSTAAPRGTGPVLFRGVLLQLAALMSDAEAETPEALIPYLGESPCPACGGARLKPAALAVGVRGRSIADVCADPIAEARRFFDGIAWSEREWAIGQQMIKEITDRLRFLDDVGVGYLTLHRRAGSLAGGEIQRIRLATQIGSQLTGVLYVLDEPSIGLHMRDNERLLGALRRLRDIGNTVIVVEHDETTMRASDYLIDLGPGAGRLGGEIVAAGVPAEVMLAKNSLTADYLTGRRSIPVPDKRRAVDPKRRLVIEGAAEHNLKSIDVSFPLGTFICVTGVSGSGKSTLVDDVLFPAAARELERWGHTPGRHRRLRGADLIDKIIEVDQSPIGRTPRSNCATYTQVFTHIRQMFANTTEGRMHGLKPGHFSFNVAGGRCEACNGAGSIKLEMAFLPNVYVTCEVCQGRRYGPEALAVRYRGRTIAEVLDMTVAEGLEFFAKVPRVEAILQTVHDVGLDYIHIGQQATTLSGGEAQRIRLSRELAKRNTGRTLYILDEPTTGLHFEDIRKLIEVLQRLVDTGSTVIVIEHNLDVIKCADWVIDLGPEGGEAGGYLVGEGTPEAIAKLKTSHTGRFLREVLRGN